MRHTTHTLMLAALVMVIGACATSDTGPPDAGFGYQSVEHELSGIRHEPEIPEEQPLDRLRPGMTREQVRDMFGPPDSIAPSTVRDERWDYPFGELYFRNGRLHIWFNLGETRS